MTGHDPEMWIDNGGIKWYRCRRCGLPGPLAVFEETDCDKIRAANETHDWEFIAINVPFKLILSGVRIEQQSSRVYRCRKCGSKRQEPPTTGDTCQRKLLELALE
jgi:DNA-directed RNA polymerase subunit RPC12/RpoP